MKFYERYFENNYDELITYYPRFYREIFEMVEILKAFGRVSDELEDNIEQAYLNNFILAADLDTVKIWEKILHITYEGTLSLDQRKHVIIGRISGYGHIGEPEIRGTISNYTDNAVEIDFADGVISIVIDGEIFDEQNLLDTLLRRIPAHLELAICIRTLRVFRHDLKVIYRGAVKSDCSSLPVSKDRASITEISLSCGGAVSSEMIFQPKSENRTAAVAISVGYGGILSSKQTGKPPNLKNASERLIENSGGIYYHTHTKSKLIG